MAGPQQLKIFDKDLLWDEEHMFGHYEVYCYGTKKVLTDRMILVDYAYAKVHPSSIPEELRSKVLRRIGYKDKTEVSTGGERRERVVLHRLKSGCITYQS